MEITFTKQIVDTQMDNTHAVVAADFDGDNDIDIASTNFILDYVAWFQNDGSENFSKIAIDGQLSGSLDGSNLEGAYPINLGDVNQDGNIDVLATGYEADATVWYENDGNGNFTRRDVDLNADGAHSIVPGDIDLDGDIDLLTTNQDAGTVTWYENDGNENFTLRLVDNNLRRAKYADLADIDGDGDIDFFSAGDEDGIVAWYENDGSQNFTREIIDDTAAGAYFTFATDLNQDGFIDVVTAQRLANTVAWYENDGNANFTKRVIDDEAEGARSVYVIDLDDDGNLDVLSASVDDDTVSWYQHDGNGNFTQQIIDDFADGAYGIFAADVDGDGLTDVLSAGRDDFTVAWYRQSRELNASPEVTNPITDLIIPEELGTQTLDLSNFFIDPDGDQITFSVESNSNVELVTTVLDGSNLNLDLLDGQFGTADITVRATANGQFVDETFTVTVGDNNSEGSILNSPIYRFQSNITLGTYLYVQEEERVSINQNFNDSFIEEGIAFNAAIEPDDELIPFFRFQNNQMPGTYLYAGQAERDSINIDPNLANNFTDEGIAFYAYGVGAGEETPFYRFQNSDVPGTYIYATGTEADTIRADFPNYIEEGIAFEARI
ncbi:MAG: FG-GAP repeat domain-containing protein [Xenococcus sp. (in: cyanobacteria)]